MTQERTWLRETVVFVLVAVLALVVSFTFVFPRHWSRGFLGPDEAWHADLARHVLAGDGYVSSTLFPMDAPSTEGFPVTESLKQSGLALTTVAVWWVFGESERAVIVIVMLTFAVGVGLTQLLAYRLTRHRGVALLVAGLVLANPAVLSTMLTALPVSLVFTTFVLLLLLVVEPTPQRLVLAGLVYVALLLAKGYGILYFLPIVGYLAATSRGVKMPLLFGGSVVLWVVAAQLTLPAGSFRLVNSGANYALAFLHEWWYPQTVYAFRDLAPPDPWTVIAEHPREFAVHYARLASRTKRILDGMAGPAIGTVFSPLLWVAMVALPVDRLRPGRFLPTLAPNAPPLLRDINILVLLSSSILLTLSFFWAIGPHFQYWMHLYPIMLLLCIGLIWRFLPLGRLIPRRGRELLAGAAFVYLLVYPLALTFREVYKNPFAYFGRTMTVRSLDYGELSETLATWVPDRAGVVVSDMANEIAWWNGNPTIYFPLDEEQLEFLVERFDVQALYERPGPDRDWNYMRETFRLVDTRNGLLWVRDEVEK